MEWLHQSIFWNSSKFIKLGKWTIERIVLFDWSIRRWKCRWLYVLIRAVWSHRTLYVKCCWNVFYFVTWRWTLLCKKTQLCCSTRCMIISWRIMNWLLINCLFVVFYIVRSMLLFLFCLLMCLSIKTNMIENYEFIRRENWIFVKLNSFNIWFWYYYWKIWWKELW